MPRRPQIADTRASVPAGRRSRPKRHAPRPVSASLPQMSKGSGPRSRPEQHPAPERRRRKKQKIQTPSASSRKKRRNRDPLVASIPMGPLVAPRPENRPSLGARPLSSLDRAPLYQGLRRHASIKRPCASRPGRDLKARRGEPYVVQRSSKDVAGDHRKARRLWETRHRYCIENSTNQQRTCFSGPPGWTDRSAEPQPCSSGRSTYSAESAGLVSSCRNRSKRPGGLQRRRNLPREAFIRQGRAQEIG
jgi:hypothetical protein